MLAASAGPDLVWEEPARSAATGFRNKAKMAVGGSLTAPTLGLVGLDGSAVDLRDCVLHSPGLVAALPVLAEFITMAAVAPYSLVQRRGELKHLLVTESPTGALMVRFVVRSREPETRIRKHLPWLRERLPAAEVITLNLQPDHKAVLEGDQEIVLSDSALLAMPIDGVGPTTLELALRPQGFFQTNTAMAAELYRTAGRWTAESPARSVWDLYSGVGGFALALAGAGREVLGVEVSSEAVAAGNAVAPAGVEFIAADATEFALQAPSAPDLVVLNPPRRGIGDTLAGWLETATVEEVLYSSCNALTLQRDLAAMPSLRPVRARVLDMFPHTDHYELLVQLRRAPR